MISSIGAISSGGYDSEYQRIITELKRRNMVVTGDKKVDKANLQKVKQKESEAEAFVQAKIDENPDGSDKERQKLEELRVGAMNLAEINKVLLGLNV